MMIQKYIKQLPQELLYHIISYTYQPQSKTLLEDIESFYESRCRVNEIFHQTYAVEWNMEYPEEKYWLSNDLVRYMNNNIPTLLGYDSKLYNIFYRHYLLNLTNDVKYYMISRENGAIEAAINSFWGPFI